MTRHSTIAFVIVINLTHMLVAQPDEAQQVFESLYGAKIKAAVGTIDRADDMALARELVDAAKASADTPALLALMCEAAHDLGQRHADGFGSAADAMALLAKQVESKRDGAREKLVDILTRQSRIGKPDERDAANTRLIDTLLAMGDQKMAQSQWSEAAVDYRRAMLAAATKKLPQTEAAKVKLESAMRRDRAAKQITRLTEKLLEDANDSASAEQIVRLHIVEFDDPKAALPFLNRVKDERLRSLLPAAADPSLAKDQDLLPLGEWYRELAGPNPGPTELPLLRRASACLSQFMQSTSATSLAGRKAELVHKEVDALVKKFESVAPMAGAAASPAAMRWTSVLDWIDADKDKRMGDWKSGKDGVVLQQIRGWNVLNSTIQVTGDYDVRCRITPTAHNDGLIIQLPVASKYVDVVLSARAGAFHTIRRSREEEKQRLDWWTPGTLVNGKPVLVEVQIRHSDNDKKLKVELSLDGKRIGGWTEAIDKIETDLHWANRSPTTINLGTWESGMKFDLLEVRLIDGKLKKLPWSK